MAVTRHLKRPTREHGAGRPLALPYLVLLRVGFTKPEGSPLLLVRSYRTFSPLPAARLLRRYVFCGTFRRVTPPGRYPALCPVELGLSSGARTFLWRLSLQKQGATSDHPGYWEI